MATAPTGPLSRAILHCETLIANSAAFRTAVGAVTVADARNRIFFPHASDTDLRPLAIITPSGYGHERDGPANWAEDGELDVSFEFPIPDPEAMDNKDAWIFFGNQWEAIYQEMRDNSGLFDASGNPMLNFTNSSISLLPEASDESEDEEYHGVMITLNYIGQG